MFIYDPPKIDFSPFLLDSVIIIIYDLLIQQPIYLYCLVISKDIMESNSNLSE